MDAKQCGSGGVYGNAPVMGIVSAILSLTAARARVINDWSAREMVGVCMRVSYMGKQLIGHALMAFVEVREGTFFVSVCCCFDVRYSKTCKRKHTKNQSDTFVWLTVDIQKRH